MSEFAAETVKLPTIQDPDEGNYVHQSRKTRPANTARNNLSLKLFTDAFSLQFWIGLGCFLTILMPGSYRVVPFIALWAPLAFKMLAVRTGLISNPHVAGIQPKRTAAHPEGDMSVMIFGARANGWLGALDPDFQWAGQVLEESLKVLDNDPNSGLIGYECYLTTERASNNWIMVHTYFRTAEDAYRFARTLRPVGGTPGSPLAHSKVIGNYWRRKNSTCLELFHELYEIKDGAAHSVYYNSSGWGLSNLWYKEPGDAEGSGEATYKNYFIRGHGSKRRSGIKSINETL